MPNPNNKLDRTRLRKALEFSRTELKPFRQHRLRALEFLVGKHYSNGGPSDKQPVNLLELATTIYLQQLVGATPQAQITTPYRDFKPSAALLQLGLNQTLKEIRIRKTLASVVFDSIFSMGIIKVGLNVSQIEVGGEFHDAGQPFADAVHLDDWVHDMTARCFEETEFRGNRYRLPLEVVMDSGLYDREAAEQAFKFSSDDLLNESGDKRSETLSRDGAGHDTDNEFHKHVELWDLYLPLEGLVVTLPYNGSGKPLRVVDWEGPEGGPFKILSYREIPNNVMPLPPIAGWMDLHDLTNRLFNKLGRQAERQKTVTVVSGDGKEDGNRIKNADDGEMVWSDNPGATHEVRYGGVDNNGLAFVIQLQDMFSRQAGNLDAIGGLGSQTDTARQDELIASSASQRLQSMQLEVLEFTSEVMRDIAWYLFYDPLIEMPLTRRIEGTDITIPVTFTADQLEGEFLDYNFDIQPFSMQHQTPQSKLRSINQVMTSIVFPMLPFLQEQGITVSMENMMRIFSEYSNLPELMEILEFAGEQKGFQRQPVGQQPVKSPAISEKRIIRENRSTGGTRQARDQAMVNALMGIGQQDSQAARLARPPA